jgi:hypothetical protein
MTRGINYKQRSDKSASRMKRVHGSYESWTTRAFIGTNFLRGEEGPSHPPGRRAGIMRRISSDGKEIMHANGNEQNPWPIRHTWNKLRL